LLHSFVVALRSVASTDAVAIGRGHRCPVIELE
jgi:hypothetical protein